MACSMINCYTDMSAHVTVIHAVKLTAGGVVCATVGVVYAPVVYVDCWNRTSLA